MKKIVILGAGFGGLRAAVKLGRAVKWGFLKDHEIILIDKNNYHTYTPLLYEAATTSKNVADYLNLKSLVTFPIDKVLKRLPIKFVEDEVEDMDLSAHEMSLHLKSGYNIHYDYLIMAAGSAPNYFNIPGLKEYAKPFKTFTDALIIRDIIWDAITKGTASGEEFKIVVGGGGSTGVEFASELRLWLNQVDKKYKKNASVTICEGAPAILPGFEGKVVAKVEARLKKIGVKIVAGKMIKSVSVENKTITLGGEQIPDETLGADLLIWTGGVKPSDLLENMPIKMKKGRADVSYEMACLPIGPDLTFAGQVFGIGDVICVYDQLSGKPVPMVAQAALLQADIAVKNIIRGANGRKGVEYKPKEYPYIMPVGGKYAVAKIGRFVISGFFAWVLKGLVELRYLISIMPTWRAMLIWLKGLYIFTRNERLG